MPQLDITIISLYFTLTIILITVCYFFFIIAFFKPTVYALKIILKRFLQYTLFLYNLIDTPNRLRASNLYNRALRRLKKWI